LVTGANVTQILHPAFKLSDFASTKSPIKGDKAKVGAFSYSNFKLHYWLSLAHLHPLVQAYVPQVPIPQSKLDTPSLLTKR